jgi:hypothetical protein
VVSCLARVSAVSPSPLVTQYRNLRTEREGRGGGRALSTTYTVADAPDTIRVTPIKVSRISKARST